MAQKRYSDEGAHGTCKICKKTIEHYKNELKWYAGFNDLQLELFLKKQSHIKN